MPAADLHASTGSLHIIKARGRFAVASSLSQPTQATSGPHTLIYLSCLCERLFPPRERWGLTRFTHVYEMKFILGKAHWLPLTEKKPFLLPSPFSPSLRLPPYTLPPFPEWESVMDVHVHNVSKNTSVTAAFTSSVLYSSMIALLALTITILYYTIL